MATYSYVETQADAERNKWPSREFSEDGLCKRCSKCQEMVPLSDFYTRKRKDGTRFPVSNCRNCERVSVAARNEKVRLAGRPKVPYAQKRQWRLKHRYRLTPEQFDELAKDGCFICGSFDNLAVDHNHLCCAGRKSCGECVRGILCRKHNQAEGCFSDVELLRLLEYRVQFVDVLGALQDGQYIFVG